MIRRGTTRRVFAIIFTFIMLVSGINIPAEKVKAGDRIDLLPYITASGTTANAAADGSNKPSASVLFSLPDSLDEKSELAAAGVTWLEVTLSVSDFTPYSGETAGAMLHFMDGTSYKWNAGDWANLTTSGNITLRLNMQTLDWGSGTKVGKMGIQFANLNDASTVTYNIVSAAFTIGEGGGSGSSTDFGTDRDNESGVTASVAAQGTPSADWSGFDVSLSNNTGQSVCDWIVVLQVPASAVNSFKCWNSTFVADGSTIYLYPMQSGQNAVLSAGAMSANTPGFGFGGTLVNVSDITVSKVMFNYGSSSAYDYSSGNTNDSSQSGGGGITIPSGDLTDYNYPDIDYNYAKLLQYSLYFYDANMCGSDVGEKSLLDWRDDCHTFDKTTYRRSDGSTVEVNLNGGFHDAGDHVKFGLPEAYAAFTLGMSYDTDKAAYAAAKQSGHLETITTHFADYLVNCTVLNTAGDKVEAFCCQVGMGDAGYDHGYWGAPEDQTNSNRPIYFTSSQAPSTDIVSLSAAALAMQYKNFGGDKYLDTAKKLFAYARDNSKAVNTTAGRFYVSSAWEDDYCLAAVILYDITKDSTYLTEYNKYASSANALKAYWPLSWDNMGPAVAYYQNNKNVLSTVMGIGDLDSTHGGYGCVSDWGSARYNTSMQYTGLLYDKMSGTDTYREWAEGQMKYLLGNNAAKQCFVTGYNAYSPKYPHHRAASGYTGGDKGTTAQAHTLVGALVGGQMKNGTYTDSASDYTCNEVTIDYNATLAAASAAIYDRYISDTDNQYIDTNYYYDGDNPNPPVQTVSVTGINLNKDEITLTKGTTDTASLAAEVLPANASDKTVSWSSSDESVATVSSKGKVTAVAAGETVITVTTTDGGFTDICKVKVYVKNATPAAPTVSSKTETTVTLSAITGCEYSKDKVNWQDSTVFANLEPNTKYTFYARKKADGYYLVSSPSAGTTVTTDKIYASGIALDKTSVELELGVTATAKLNATVTPDSASVKTVKYTSSAPEVATVDTNGNITAKSSGRTVITAVVDDGRANAPKADCTVTVWYTPEAPDNPPVMENQGTTSITLEAKDGYEYSKDGVNWQDSPVFSGLSPDTEYTFYMRKKKDEGNYQNAGAVTEITLSTLPEGIQAVDVTGVELDKTSVTLNKETDNTVYLNATVLPDNATTKTVKYISSNPKVATVDADGRVTAASAGEATITVITDHKGMTDTCVVKVYAKHKTPAAPEIVSVTTNTITLRSISGCEYSKDGVNWQSSNVFKDLKSGTTYTFYVRKKAAGYYTLSDKSRGTNGTTKANPKPAVTPNVNVSYRTHVQSFGWQGFVANGIMSGTSGMAKRLEGIEINLKGNDNVGIQYTTHCQSYGWLPWSSNGDMSGTEGEAKRLEAIMIQLTGADAAKYDVYYRVHAQSYGWLGWAKNGAPAGTAGYAKRLEGIQIVVVKKGESFNKSMQGITSVRNEAYVAQAGTSPVVGGMTTSAQNPVIGGADTPNVVYKTHVQSYGWQGWKYNGQMSGTSGEAKRLEGINIKLTNKPYSGGISYTTHVQSYGWQGSMKDSSTWKKDGQMSGTSGEAKRLEAICITLTGEMAKHYDVYYRVHAQSFGWLDWAKNGAPAGTAGYAKRLEGIEIVLVPKGGRAPGLTDRPYVEK